MLIINIMVKFVLFRNKKIFYYNIMTHILKGLLIPMSLLLTAFFSAAKIAENRTLLIDKETEEPLVLASIIDRNGTIIALTGNDGTIPDLPTNAFPVTFSYMGYSPLEVHAVTNGNIGLTPKTFELSEVVISPGIRPLLHITGYMREYTSSFGSKDSLTIYKEAIVDFLIPIAKTKNKGWQKPRILASNTYQRHTDAKGLDSVSNNTDNIYLMASHLNVFPSSTSSMLNLPKKIANASGVASETVYTKKNAKMDWQRNGDVIRLNHDGLTQFPNHIYTPNALKVIGATTDFTEVLTSYIFITNEGESAITPADLCQISLSLKMTGRGKAYKWAFDSQTPLDMRSYIEIYITDREYVSEEEGKKLKKNPPVVGSKIRAPKEATALHPGIQKIIKRVKTQ